MEREKFLEVARDTVLTESQAEAFWHRHVAGHSRREAADAMDCSASNVDQQEAAARDRIIRAHNRVTLAGAVDAEPGDWGALIGTCARCDEPQSAMKPDPRDEGQPIEDMRMVCAECFDELGAEI
jgi:hypothetical protein